MNCSDLNQKLIDSEKCKLKTALKHKEYLEY